MVNTKGVNLEIYNMSNEFITFDNLSYYNSKIQDRYATKSELDTKVDKNGDEISGILTISGSLELPNSPDNPETATVTDAYITRKTANAYTTGLSVVDNTITSVEEIKGKTVKSTNLACNEYSTITDGENGILFNRIKGVSYFQVYGTPTAAGGRTVFKVTIAKAGRYTLSVPNLPILRLELLRNGTSFLTMSKGAQKSISFNIAEDNTIFAVSAVANTADTLGTESNPTTIELMLTEGDLGYVNYTPYFSGLKHAFIDRIKSKNSNLLPYPYYDGVSKTQNGITFTVKDDGRIILNGQNNGVGGSLFELHKESPFVLPAGTYIGTSAKNTKVLMMAIDTTGKYYSFGVGFTLDQDTTFNRIYIGLNKGDTAVFNNYVYEPILNIGSSLLSFVTPQTDTYQLPQTLELAEYDYINPQTGEYVQGTRTIVCDGTENWQIADVNYNTYKLDIYPKVSSKRTVIHSNTSFGVRASGGSDTVGWSIIEIHDCTFASVEELKSYLTSNPLTISYKLKTPTIEILTNYPNEYTAYNNGSETVEQGDTDNSQWGAIPTITQTYSIHENPTEASTKAYVNNGLAKKLDKTGGTITGNLIVENGLIATLPALVVKNDSDIYGLVLEGDTCKLGKGFINEFGSFQLNQDEGLPVALRDISDNFEDGHIVKWSVQGNKFVDGGVIEIPQIDTSNLVTLDTEQNITGKKHFTGTLSVNNGGLNTINGGVIISNKVTVGYSTAFTNYSQTGISITKTDLGGNTTSTNFYFPESTGTIATREWTQEQAEGWTFVLADGTSVTKKVVLA